jgi:hypothetical protein
MKPYIICHMVASLDGRINSGHWSRSPDGDRKAWSALRFELAFLGRNQSVVFVIVRGLKLPPSSDSITSLPRRNHRKR